MTLVVLIHLCNDAFFGLFSIRATTLPRLPSLSTNERCRLAALSRDDRKVHLAGRYSYPQAILKRRERTHPTIIVGAGRIVGVIEIKRHPPAGSWQRLAPLDGVEEIAPTAIALSGTGRIAKGEEQSAAINVQPVQRKGDDFAIYGEANMPYSRHGHSFIGIHRHLLAYWLNLS